VSGPAGTKPAGRDIRRTRLDSGLRIVTETLPALRSVSVGFWVGVGSRDEHDGQFGASHFLEHLLFKGTADRSAAQIAHAVESVGGDMNAFTAQEMTSFYVRVPDDELDLALDILAEVVWAPALRPNDVDAERNVILEEIRMRDDAPEDLVHELFSEAMFPDHPLGREVLGTNGSVADMTRDSIEQFHARNYAPSAIVVAAAGNLEHDQVVDRIAAHPAALRSVPEVELGRSVEGLANARSRAVMTKPAEQVHVVLGTRGISRDDPDRYPLTVLNQALGGGMSSRLFQEVREKRGLAYSVYSYHSMYAEAGLFCAYVGTTPARAKESAAIVSGQLEDVAEKGLTPDEFERAKEHMKGSLVLSLEDPGGRMSRLGRSEISHGEILTTNQILRRIGAVTPEDAGRAAQRVLSQPMTQTVLGPFSKGVLA
jgi:predicted Zn-dependent peptidase